MINDMIELIRGDTLSFNFVVEFDGDPQELDAVSFACKKNIDDDSPLFERTLGEGVSIIRRDYSKIYYVVRVRPSDTRGLSVGQYHYDLQIELNDDIYTIMAGILQIQEDVTR